MITEERFEDIQTLVEDLGKRSHTRITVMQMSGTVLGDSLENPKNMDNHLNREEVVAALKNKVGVSVRHSKTIDRDFMYVAKQLKENDKTIGIVRVAVFFESLNESLSDIFFQFLVGTLLIALAVALVSWRIARNLTRPLEKMRNLARKMSQGDFDARFAVEDSMPEELELLGKTLNRISIQLNQRIETILNQKNEMAAILSSMIEGVLAVDNEGKILNLNEAAADILGIEIKDSKQLTLYQHLQNTDLEQFVNQVMDGFFPMETEVELSGEVPLSLQIHGAPLIGEHGERSGAVFVFNDITRLRQLENHRSDFVANVSHELRTPLTSMKGFIETLREGAIEDPEASRKFLGIIDRHTNRLGAIIEDLLALSRLERDIEDHEVQLQKENIKPVILACLEICEVKAAKKEIQFEIEIEDNLTGLVNAPLMEQALINLIDNAIKYSEPKSKIFIKAKQKGDEVCVEVHDQGAGIPDEHLPRLFERFYRVDKARSRKLGGTGLGLSIVKHIAIAHGGRVSVESKVGQGSVFYFWIRAKQRNEGHQRSDQ